MSEQRRLPRLGKIRLGIKKVSPKGVEYPSETDYFVVPPEVVKVYGEKPKELDIMIPVEDSNISIPQAYEMYGSGKGLKCVGDGETAFRLDDKSHEMNEIDCPCEHFGHACKQRAHLRFILPKVNVGGVYQIDTSSYNSIIDLNSGIDYIRALVGRIALVPLKLKRIPTETHHEGKKQTHYTLKIELEADINFINTLRENTSRILAHSQYSLPAPTLENPAIDEGATVETEAEPAPLGAYSPQQGQPATLPQQGEPGATTTILSDGVIGMVTGIRKETKTNRKTKEKFIVFHIKLDNNIEYTASGKDAESLMNFANDARKNGLNITLKTKGDAYNTITEIDTVEPDFNPIKDFREKPDDDINQEAIPF